MLPPDFFLEVLDAKLITSNLRPSGGRTIARLHPGITPLQAQAEISSLIPGGHDQITPLASAFHSNDFRPLVLLLEPRASCC
ncbi:MAG TPA: hypothetical protein VEU96_30620 [Bryobacteraceae bacterium]|nr:hypothetical protein [Bryobacteraceae bacterium]